MTKITVVEPSFTVPPHTINTLKGLPEHIELCGRKCYQSEDRITKDSAERFINMICKNQHLSVLEHSCLTVFIVCSRCCSHQLVRHRLGSYSQSSQRYINYNKKGIEVICPSSIGAPVGEYEIDVYRGLINGEHKSEWNWLLAVANTYNEYNYQIEQGIKPEDARYILPNCVATQIAVTFNLRMWKYVFKERALNKYAQWEIRQLFSSILELFSKELPCFFGDLIV